MATNKNIIEYGICNVHYAKITNSGLSGTYTYDTPKKLEGAVSITISPIGESTSLYGDNVELMEIATNGGYDGTISFLNINNDFRKDILGEIVDTAGVQIEESTAKPSEFALMFEFDGDVNETRHVLYRCKCKRPNLSSKTQTNTVEHETQELSLSVRPRITDKRVKAKIENTVEGKTVYDAWFTKVYETTAE